MMLKEKCKYCNGEYLKMLDTHEFVCSNCGYIRDSEYFKPGCKSQNYD